MAAISGREGQVSWSGSNYAVNISRWTLNNAQAELDVTAFAATPPTSKTFIASGLSEWSGSFEGFADDTTVTTAPDNPGTLETLTLRLKDKTTTDYTYSGTAFVVSDEVVTGMDDSVKITVQFRGSGDLTRAIGS